ncbi:unnamed protein product [Boreogadus saida]
MCTHRQAFCMTAQVVLSEARVSYVVADGISRTGGGQPALPSSGPNLHLPSPASQRIPRRVLTNHLFHYCVSDRITAFLSAEGLFGLPDVRPTEANRQDSRAWYGSGTVSVSDEVRVQTLESALGWLCPTRDTF